MRRTLVASILFISAVVPPASWAQDRRPSVPAARTAPAFGARPDEAITAGEGHVREARILDRTDRLVFAGRRNR